jgi:predicted phage-related endonuclease
MTATTETRLEPGSPGWLRLMTASKVAAILGASKWDSPRSMWHKMKNELPTEVETAVQSRGHYLEPAVLAWWRDKHDAAAYTHQPLFTLNGWAAATPDASANILEGDTPRTVLVEAKSARELEEWGQPGTDDIPGEYLIQCYWQMHVSGIHRCYVPIIGTFLDFEEYVVDYDPEVGALLEERCREFMESLAAATPPPLDDHPATYDALRKLYREIDDSEVEIPHAVAVEYLTALTERKAAEARERKAKATVLDLMGTTRYATTGSVRVARRQPNPTGFQLNQVAKSAADIPDPIDSEGHQS